ncbi:hypothetical protein Y032_0207g2023 [Ancylostoma ceylanicum]|uniref:Peptidase M12A domain-containing protein n=1 Tax=Ancylostoma ceylanicum TaxID=53326 RepID=A0A016SLW6_9BILA|nr:hypothetical protein Y032_0207g2023 [Ancylostoma ceylanicum]
MHRLLLVVAAVLVVLANCQGEQQHGPEMSRYFNEDGRTADYMPDAMKGFVTKRKQIDVSVQRKFTYLNASVNTFTPGNLNDASGA